MKRSLFILSLVCELTLLSFALHRCAYGQQAQLPTKDVTIDPIIVAPDYEKGALERVSADGKIVYGSYFSKQSPPLVWFPYRWSKQDGFVRLPGEYTDQPQKQDPRVDRWLAKLPAAKRKDVGDLTYPVMSADGSFVVGTTGIFPDTHPFLWREDLGFMDLNQYIHSIPTLKGWSLYIYHDVVLSADGTTIVLDGANEANKGQSHFQYVCLYNPSGFGKSGKSPGTGDSTPATDDIVFADFESGTYDGWTLEGNCWSSAPTSDQTFPDRISGFHGKRFVCTFTGKLGVAATGKATSKEFTLQKPFITFLIGGGKRPGLTCLNLVVDDKIVRTETGNDRKVLEPASWDVRELQGKKAHFEIVDSSTASNLGFILVDNIVFTAHPPLKPRSTP